MSDLRLQLLEPDRYPYLYKCLYGLLMLLPQSSAFAALKNRLNSVSAIGLLHTPAAMPSSSGPRPSYVSSFPSSSTTPTPSHTRQKSADRIPLNTIGSLTSASSSVVAGMSSASLPNAAGSTVPGRLGRSTRELGSGSSDVKWPELVEKFRATQEKARRRNERAMRGEAEQDLGGGPATRSLLELDTGRRRNGQRSIEELRGHVRPGSGLGKPLPNRPDSAQGGNLPQRVGGGPGPAVNSYGGASSGFGNERGHKSRHSLAGNLGKMISRGASQKERKDESRYGAGAGAAGRK